jgi:DNA topoisomerase-2
MAFWSLTYERLERLKAAILKKKAEYDELAAKSEKDLWCTDLEEFVSEWETQLALDSQIQSNIRRMGRRVSKKIGAGGKSTTRRKADDDYEPTERKRAPKAKAAAAPKEKAQERFAAMFDKNKLKVDAAPDSDNFSDDDFAALTRKPAAAKPKPAAKAPPVFKDESDDDFESLVSKPVVAKAMMVTKKPTPVPKDESDAFTDNDLTDAPKPDEPSSVVASPEPPVNARRRAAAARKPAYVLDDTDTDASDTVLGDVGAMVKGIKESSGSGDGPKEAKSGRLSLFSMARPDSSHGTKESALPKLKTKPSKPAFNDSDDDETNYEMLARSSPHKSPFKEDDIDSFLSDDAFPPPKKAAPKAVKPAPAAEPVKKRGRPAGSKNKAKDDEDPKPVKAKPAPKAAAKAAPKATAKAVPKVKAAAKPVTLSPAAKAYAAKKAAAAKRDELDDDSDAMDVDVDADESLPPRPAARARPGRAAAAKAKAKPVYFDDDSSMADPMSEDPIELDDDSD